MIVCFISASQRTEYKEELDEICRLGPEVAFEESLADVLRLIQARKPSLVIAGSTVGDVEGIEFLATLLAQQPEYTEPVVVLSEKADGLSPVVYSRKPSPAGSTSVGAVDLVAFVTFIAGGSAASPRERGVTK